ncbi:MAG: FAD-binding and (Fe-S)-binding domain-containing protein [Paludibacter sp.]
MKYTKYKNAIIKKLPQNRVFTDEVRRLAWGTDASFYRLIPKIVIKAQNEDEVSFILRESAKFSIPVTFRAAGTSLSGQSITDSVLIIAGNDWEKFSIADDGNQITLQPGVIGSKANSMLAQFGRKIGPDPASINSAMIGGIAANNASGMCCGTAQNSYKTVTGMRIIFADGSMLNTSDEASKEAFKTSHSNLIANIVQLVADVKANKELTNRIIHKYKMKNTTGYSLNALVDFSDPFQVIEHLMIGSEGTLGFISEITYQTVVEHPYKASAMMIFSNIENACNVVSLLKSAPVSAVELIDRAGLRSVENVMGMPEYLKTLNIGASAILVETRALNKQTLDSQIAEIQHIVSVVTPEIPILFSNVAAEYDKLWKIRKGLFPSVGSMRKTGTTVIIEDVAFPVSRLAEATLDLQKLFAKWQYNEAVIFGHALEGNLHFVFTQDFSKPSEIERYSGFMTEVATLVVDKYDGSLKAEHGTGRNMAPFVEMEWGQEAFDLMKRIKRIFDPNKLLNPGVILNTDKDSHIKNLKPLPATNHHVDKCIECGFCEVNCLTNGFSLSARQRIVVQREISRLRKTGEDNPRLNELVHDFRYLGEQTCVGDGLCSTSCPVGINTGELIHDLRAANNYAFPAKQLGAFTAKKFGLITPIMPPALNLINSAHTVLGTKTFGSIAKSLRYISGNTIPLWTPAMPKGISRPQKRKVNNKNPLKVVYFPSCINQTMGPAQNDPEQKSLHITLVNFLEKAGYEVIFPEKMKQLCCGTIWESKGFYKEADKKSDELENVLLNATENGKYPVICDQSPCLYRMRNTMKEPLKLYEPVEFIVEFLTDKLRFTKTDEPVAIHVTCSMTKMNLKDKIVNLAEMCSNNVLVPEEVGCCGFAGDKGFTYPEVNKYALRKLKPQIDASKIKLGYSNSRTCEIGLSTYSGISYQSIVYLVDKCTTSHKL